MTSQGPLLSASTSSASNPSSGRTATDISAPTQAAPVSKRSPTAPPALSTGKAPPIFDCEKLVALAPAVLRGYQTRAADDAIPTWDNGWSIKCWWHQSGDIKKSGHERHVKIILDKQPDYVWNSDTCSDAVNYPGNVSLSSYYLNHPPESCLLRTGDRFWARTPEFTLAIEYFCPDGVCLPVRLPNLAPKTLLQRRRQ